MCIRDSLTANPSMEDVSNSGILFFMVTGFERVLPKDSFKYMFSVKHEKLGEDIAAAVVLKDGSTVDDKDLRTYLSNSITTFKIPRPILILDEIPKGNTGKIQRIGLAKKLGLEK